MRYTLFCDEGLLVPSIDGHDMIYIVIPNEILS